MKNIECMEFKLVKIFIEIKLKERVDGEFYEFI